MNLKNPFGELPLALLDPIGIVSALADRRSKRRIQRLHRATAIKQLREHLLAFGREEQLELFNKVSVPAVTVSTQSFCRDVANTWTDQQIIALCDGVIQSSLEGLTTFVNSDRRRELLTWFAPSSDPAETLSFAFCCRVAGLNPEPIYTQVWKMYKDEIRGFLADQRRFERSEEQAELQFA